MDLVPLQKTNGASFWVNPAAVSHILPFDADDGSPTSSTVIYLINGASVQVRGDLSEVVIQLQR
jgi:uncharacterized protein YlzI (FlbEa/FlbD family)